MSKEGSNLTGLQMTAVVVMRVLIGWHFLYEGVAKLSKPDWTAAGFLKQARGPLADLFHGMAANPNALEIVNPLNMWGLTLIGLGLIVGCFTRTAAASGMLIILMYYLLQPPVRGLLLLDPHGGQLPGRQQEPGGAGRAGRRPGDGQRARGGARSDHPRAPPKEPPSRPRLINARAVEQREGRAMNDESGILSAAFTRRDVIKTASLASLAAAFPGGLFAAGASEKIRVGLIGCGGRGTDAAMNCVEASPDVVIAALGDVFPDQLAWSLGQLKQKLPAGRLTATPETCFTGFDAYQKVLAAGVDLVILATPPFFRPAHLEAAIEAGKHVFTEKPVAVDPLGVRSVIATSELAASKRLGHRRRHPAPPPGPLPRDHEAHPGRRHRRARLRPVLLEHGRPVGRAGRRELGQQDREELVGHGVAGPQLALHRLGLAATTSSSSTSTTSTS